MRDDIGIEGVFGVPNRIFGWAPDSQNVLMP